LTSTATSDHLSVACRDIADPQLIMLDCGIQGSIWQVFAVDQEGLVEQEVDPAAYVVENASAAQLLKNTTWGLIISLGRGFGVLDNLAKLLRDQPGPPDQVCLMTPGISTNSVKCRALPTSQPNPHS
jgi:hypothetical protein